MIPSELVFGVTGSQATHRGARPLGFLLQGPLTLGALSLLRVTGEGSVLQRGRG